MNQVKKNPEIDAYIADAEAFAVPILKHLRKVIHKNCPSTEETIKWNGSSLGKKLGEEATQEIENLGEIKNLKDLPSDAFLGKLIKLAMTFNEPGAAIPKKPARAKKPAPKAPTDLLKSLRGNPDALKVFQNFSPTNQREYIEWITSAKTDETRERRLETAVEWIADGKSRNWKYQK